ncbi:diaminopimelate decarboxylase [Haliangium sp.]|uniref:diaminopimelate decarboxylase n=1 Tax=Haliangium sp. TaxID=2663208 RepID=UPI003D12E161
MMSQLTRPSNTDPNEIEKLKFLAPEEVREIADRFGTPVFVYDERTLEDNAKYMLGLPNAFGLTVRYSIKANPNRAILRLIDRMGLHFDASSEWEARRALAAGVQPSKILITAQEAGEGVIELIEQGVHFDAGSLEQLSFYGERFRGAEVSVRLNPGYGSGLVNRLTSGGPDSSFGIWHQQAGQIKELIDQYELKLVRLHIHIGSSHDAEVLMRSVRTILGLSKLFGGVPIIDLGGGYKVHALNSDPFYDHHEMAGLVADDLKAHAAETGTEMRLEVEPGTFMMANAGSIVTKVIDKMTTGAEGRTFLKLNAGLTEIIRPSYYGAVHPLVSVPAEGPMRSEVDAVCVAGHCCIAGDVLTPRPADVEHLAPMRLARTSIGDYLVVERGGGYCASMALKNFNSYPESAEVLRRKDGSFDLIRERQSLEQVTQNERMPADL